MGFFKDCADAFKEGWREAGANMRREQEEDRALRSLDESAREEMRNVNDPCYINLRNRGVNVAALTGARCMSDARQLIKGPCRAALPASAKPSFRLMGWQPLTSRGKVPKKAWSSASTTSTPPSAISARGSATPPTPSSTPRT